MLPRALNSSRAIRPASSLASTAMTKNPLPARPACVISSVASPPENRPSQAVPSRARVASAAVPSAIRRGVSTPAISTGSTSRAT